ncbi:hypothetical protein K378_01150 [Streptomyces sp. Amel2xB2]|nr:hypothetical protein K378_01150 [Streptomyces sp. Amel2xB2]
MFSGLPCSTTSFAVTFKQVGGGGVGGAMPCVQYWTSCHSGSVSVGAPHRDCIAGGGQGFAPPGAGGVGHDGAGDGPPCAGFAVAGVAATTPALVSSVVAPRGPRAR